MLKNEAFSTSILEGFRPRFGRAFERFLKRKMNAFRKCESILLRENQYFQGFEDNTNAKTMVKNFEKIDVFWDFVFGGILGGFWEGFGRPKSSIFALFSMFFRCHFSSALRKAQDSDFGGHENDFGRPECGGLFFMGIFGARPAECARPFGYAKSTTSTAGACKNSIRRPS